MTSQELNSAKSGFVEVEVQGAGGGGGGVAATSSTTVTVSGSGGAGSYAVSGSTRTLAALRSLSGQLVLEGPQGKRPAQMEERPASVTSFRRRAESPVSPRQ